MCFSVCSFCGYELLWPVQFRLVAKQMLISLLLTVPRQVLYWWAPSWLFSPILWDDTICAARSLCEWSLKISGEQKFRSRREWFQGAQSRNPVSCRLIEDFPSKRRWRFMTQRSREFEVLDCFISMGFIAMSFCFIFKQQPTLSISVCVYCARYWCDKFTYSAWRYRLFGFESKHFCNGTIKKLRSSLLRSTFS